MGRIKTKLVKAKTHKIIEKHSDKLGTNFEENKKILNEETEIPSKKIRNIIAGYATRLKKAEQG
jgi:small subunit ribosomal protein S17e